MRRGGERKSFGAGKKWRGVETANRRRGFETEWVAPMTVEDAEAEAAAEGLELVGRINNNATGYIDSPAEAALAYARRAGKKRTAAEREAPAARAAMSSTAATEAGPSKAEGAGSFGPASGSGWTGLWEGVPVASAPDELGPVIEDID